MMTLEQAQHEIMRHDFDTFATETPTMAAGGKGVVVPGCPACKKRFESMHQFKDHIAKDVLPAIFSYQREPGDDNDGAQTALCLPLPSVVRPAYLRRCRPAQCILQLHGSQPVLLDRRRPQAHDSGFRSEPRTAPRRLLNMTTIFGAAISPGRCR
jgi:hypothetical protein